MSVKHTEGPWYFDGHGAIWRRPPSDIYENGGEVAGDRPIATVHIGWHRDGANGYPVEANGRLIAAAPELLEALTEIVAAADGDGWKQLDPSFATARAAIAKARGETCWPDQPTLRPTTNASLRGTRKPHWRDCCKAIRSSSSSGGSDG